MTIRSNPQTSLLPSRKIRELIVISSCLFCLSCGDPVTYEQYQPIEHTLWEKDKVYYFTFQIEDASMPYDLMLEIRNNNRYPYQNLWVFFEEEQPFGPLRKDTLECMLADEFGKWYGPGISLFQSSFPLHMGYHFPIAGQYTFSFRQGMRNDRLPGIEEIGLRIAPTANAPSVRHPSAGR